MKHGNCFDCPYISEELNRRLSFYNTDLEFYESYEGMYCWCEKVGGKISIFGTCSEGDISFHEPSYSIDIENNGRGRLYRRIQRSKHIQHRKNICHYQKVASTNINSNSKRTLDFSRLVPMEWYKIDGKYAKGKIHCGCKLCKPYKGYYPSEKTEKLNNIAKDKMRDYERELAEVS